MSISSFADIIAPVLEDEFFSEYFDKAPLHIKGKPDKFASIMSWQALNGILDMTSIWGSLTLGLHLDGDYIKPVNYCVPGPDRNDQQGMMPVTKKVHDYLAQGATLVCNKVDRLTPAMSSFARIIEETFECKVQANLYCSWRERKAFSSHFDKHGVWAIQAEGSKRWLVYKGRADNPIHHDRSPVFDKEYHQKARGKVLMDIVMRPGDLLYIPHGQYHDALAMSGGTIHLTYGTYPVIGMDLLTEAYESALDVSAFRAPFPRFSGEGGEDAWDAHIDDLANRVADIIRGPDFHQHMKDYQRNYRQDRGRFELPGSIANPDYRRITDGLKIVRQNGAWILASKTDAVEIPKGGDKMIAWMLEQDHFSREQFDKAFAKKPDLFKKELLDAMIAMKVLTIQ
jgi:ribosomal protein L16 Arg81 hydroxylase